LQITDKEKTHYLVVEKVTEHEDGSATYTFDMSNDTNDVFIKDEDIRNTTEFIVDKNRPFSKLGKAGSIFYNSETTILEEYGFDGV